MSNEKAELEERFSEASSEFSLWSSFIESTGWQRVKAIAEGQLNERAKQVLRSPLASMDAALGQEYMKGEAAGIELFVKLPEVCMEQAKRDMESLQKEMTDGTETDVDGPSGSDDDSGGHDILDPERSTFGE